MHERGGTNVTIHDARKRSPGGFHETGFTLVELEKEPVTKDWRTNAKMEKGADILKFYEQMYPHIKVEVLRVQARIQSRI